MPNKKFIRLWEVGAQRCSKVFWQWTCSKSWKVTRQEEFMGDFKTLFRVYSKHLLQSAYRSITNLKCDKDWVRLELQYTTDTEPTITYLEKVWHRLLLAARRNQQRQTGQIGFESVCVLRQFLYSLCKARGSFSQNCEKNKLKQIKVTHLLIKFYEACKPVQGDMWCCGAAVTQDLPKLMNVKVSFF